MSDVERRIREALVEIDREDRAPEFRALWDGAWDRAGRREGRGRWNWKVLAPAAAAAALVAVAAGLTASGGWQTGVEAELAAATDGRLDGLATPGLTVLPSDTLARAVVDARGVDRDLLLAWNERMLGSATDWLLTLEPPVWDREEERNTP